MKTSDSGLAFLTREEGEVLHAYKDAVGIATIGVGHVVRSDESFPDGITHEQSLELLRRDVGVAEGAVCRRVSVELTQPQFDALVSFVFNVGTEAFGNSTLLRLLNQGDYAGAADQFLRWDHAGKKVLEGLARRREAERQMFLSGPEGA